MDSKTEKILSVAYALFNQHGFRKVTMSDIAEGADMSRPTLYAVYANKEAVFDGIGQRHTERAEVELAARMPRAKTVVAQLQTLFDVWILEPFASVIDSPSGLDMLGNAGTYAPASHADIYARFERHLTGILRPAMTSKRGMAAKDLAHIMTLATKGLKATTSTLAELKRLTDGLIAMAIATTEAS